jgi:putative transcriptional regulator
MTEPQDGVDDAAAGHRVACRLDALLADRGMTLTELAQRAGVTVVNLSVLKNDRARAIRFSTLTAVCDALGCQPGDLLTVVPAASSPDPRRPAGRADRG